MPTRPRGILASTEAPKLALAGGLPQRTGDPLGTVKTRARLALEKLAELPGTTGSFSF